MDARDFKCSICEVTFSDDHRPRTLPCGHSICSQCLHHIFTRGKRCPECCEDIKASNTEDIPVSHTLLRLARSFQHIQQQQQQQKGTTSAESKKDRRADAGECKVHGSLMFFRCQCCSIWVCRDCLVVDHPEPPKGNCRIVSTTKAIEESKVSSQRITKSELEKINSLKNQLEAVDSKFSTEEKEYQKVIDEHTEKMKKVVGNREQLREKLRKLEALPALLTEANGHIIGAQTPQALTDASQTAGICLASVKLVEDETENFLQQCQQGSKQSMQHSHPSHGGGGIFSGQSSTSFGSAHTSPPNFGRAHTSPPNFGSTPTNTSAFGGGLFR